MVFSNPGNHSEVFLDEKNSTQWMPTVVTDSNVDKQQKKDMTAFHTVHVVSPKCSEEFDLKKRD